MQSVTGEIVVQGKVLLATDRNGEHNKNGMVVLFLHPTAGHAVLPGLNVTGACSSCTCSV